MIVFKTVYRRPSKDVQWFQLTDPVLVEFVESMKQYMQHVINMYEDALAMEIITAWDDQESIDAAAANPIFQKLLSDRETHNRLNGITVEETRLS